MSKKYYLVGVSTHLAEAGLLDSLIVANEMRPCKHSKTAHCRGNPHYLCIVPDCRCSIRNNIIPMRYAFTNYSGEAVSVCEGTDYVLMKVKEDE